MRLHDLGHDVQPEAQALRRGRILAGPARNGSNRCTKTSGAMVPAIAHFQGNAVAAGPFEPDAAPTRPAAVLERVADQVRCHLRDAFRIP